MTSMKSSMKVSELELRRRDNSLSDEAAQMTKGELLLTHVLQPRL